jgi:glycosyltransferase involved in cell wall biosynthesis
MILQCFASSVAISVMLYNTRMGTNQSDPTQSASRGSRIILIAEIEAFGGAERSCLALSRWLYEHQLRHHFVLYKDHVNLARMASHPIRVVELKPRMRAVSKVKALRNYLKSVDEKSLKLLASGFQPALHAGLAGSKGFHTLMHDTPSLIGQNARQHGPSAKLRTRLTNWSMGRALRSGGRTMVTSEYLRQECHDLYSINADIVRMGGMIDKLNFKVRPVEGQLRMLSVSRIEPSKRIDWILRGLGMLENATPKLSTTVPWHLDVVGKGSALEGVKILSQDLGLGERVQFHGFLSDEELEQKYSLAHLFLMPALQGYGLPALESLYRGIPVLLHRESGVSDILLNTPWATVIRGGEESISEGLSSAVDTVVSGRLANVPLPSLPTEDEWAEKVATICGWI